MSSSSSSRRCQAVVFVVLAIFFGVFAGAQTPDPVQPESAPPPPADLTAANELVATGQYAEAEALLAELEPEHPDDLRLAQMRGELLVALQRYEDAVPLLERCIAATPDRERVHFQLATALQALGRSEEALDAFAREIEINEDGQIRVLAHLNRSLLQERARDLEGAAASLRAVLELDPTRKELYGDLATLLLKAGRVEEAAGSLERGLEAGFRSARMFYNVGARFFNDEAYQRAVEAFRQALEIEPDLADAERGIGGALDRLDRLDEAAPHFKRYLELRPDAPDATMIGDRIQAAGGG